MVLVRKTELACRNGWDQDLWESADGSAQRGAPQLVPVPLPVRGASEPAALPMNLMSPEEAADRLRTGDLYTDKVTSISMPLRPSTRIERLAVDASSVEPEPAASDERDAMDSTDARSAVREARRRLKEQRTAEQRRYQERRVREAGSLLDSSFALDSSSPVAGVAGQQPQPPSGQYDQQPAPSDPEPARERLPVAPQRREVGDSRLQVHFSAAPDTFSDDHTAGQPALDNRVQQPGSETSPPATTGDTPATARGGTEPLPIAAVRQNISRATPPNARPRPVRGGAVDVDRHGDRAIGAGGPVDPAIPARVTRWIPPAGSIPLTTTRSSSPIVDPALPSAFEVDPLDHDAGLHAVPRCCGTCRDFKRMGDTGQGWCTNQHAFPERRMVESDGLACRSSMGTWWLPHDDLWLERADTTHHGRPTPMLDGLARELLGGRHEMEPRSS